MADYHTETMTVREAITMSAILRLPDSISLDEKTKRVSDLLSLLRLEKCADTIIGSSMVKGISGGERKRTALAMEMVTGPSILFLDEPVRSILLLIILCIIDVWSGHVYGIQCCRYFKVAGKVWAHGDCHHSPAVL